MLRKGTVLIGVALALGIIAGLGVSAVAAGCDVAAVSTTPCAMDMSDYYMRHPGVTIPIPVVDRSDYFLRHPEVIQMADRSHLLQAMPLAAADYSDYYLRHPGATIRLSASGPTWDGGWRPGR